MGEDHEFRDMFLAWLAVAALTLVAMAFLNDTPPQSTPPVCESWYIEQYGDGDCEQYIQREQAQDFEQWRSSQYR